MRLDLADHILTPVAHMLVDVVEHALRNCKCGARPTANTPQAPLDLDQEPKCSDVAQIRQPTLTRSEGMVGPPTSSPKL